MKRFGMLFLACVAAVLLAASTAVLAGNPSPIGPAVITVATDNDLSAAVALPKNTSRIAIEVPTLDSASVSLQVSETSGGTYRDLFCFSNSTNTIKWSTAATTGGYFVEVPCNMYLYRYLKVVTGAAQTSNRTFNIYGIVDPVFDVTGR